MNCLKSIFKFISVVFPVLLIVSPAKAQFIETFEVPGKNDWGTMTGDGDAVSRISISGNRGRITVDASNDTRNVWWAIMRTTVSDDIDLELLSMPNYELRIETRIRSSHAPRRVNLHANTQRTTDFHSHLMEFDIPDTTNWHTISMTTSGFDGKPGDTVNAHIALMDWGNEVYYVDLDYFRVEVVEPESADPDLGEQVLYPPPVPEPGEFDYSEPVTESGMIDRQYPDINYSGWKDYSGRVLTADGSKIIILRWDLEKYMGSAADGYGMLKLITHSHYQATGTGMIEFDRLRLVEIIGGDSGWKRENVTLNSFIRDSYLLHVLNSQMIIDIDIPFEPGTPIHIHIPRPVIQRMLDGQTKGIALYPLGAMQASFRIQEPGNPQNSPELFFNLIRE